MKKTLIFGFTLLFFVNISLLSETPEEQLLKQKEQKIRSYSYQAKAGDRATKVSLLDGILNEFDSAKYTNKDKDLVDVVQYLAEEGSTRISVENNRVINDFPEVRRKAVMVLAKLGGDQARDALINILVIEKNQTVMAEVCNALAVVKDNDKGEALRVLIYVYRSTYKPEPNLVFGIINAVKSIASVNSTNASDAIYILTEVQMGNYNIKIREAASNAIQEISGLNNHN